MNMQFLVGVKYTKQLEDGRIKRVSEKYLFNAMSFTDAESRAYKEVGELVRGEFLITDIKRENFADIFVYDDSDIFFKVKVKYLTSDADSGRDKMTTVSMLVTADNPKQAHERIAENLKDVMISYDLTSVVLSNIVEFIPYPMD